MMNVALLRHAWLAALVVLCAGQWSCASARAAGPSPDLGDLQRQLAASESRNEGLSQRIDDLSFAVDALRLAVTRMRARIAEMENQRAQGAQPPRLAVQSVQPAAEQDPIVDLLDGLVLSDLVGPEVPAGELEATVSFDQAQGAAREGHCEQAIPALARFVRERPTDPRVPDAFLLSGSCYDQNEEYGLSVLQYQRVVDSYPGDARAATALLHLVRAHRALGETGSSDEARQQLLTDYPNSREALSLLTNPNRP
jgi:TolA-binding protein